jgi:hypothetical protein
MMPANPNPDEPTGTISIVEFAFWMQGLTTCSWIKSMSLESIQVILKANVTGLASVVTSVDADIAQLIANGAPPIQCVSQHAEWISNGSLRQKNGSKSAETFETNRRFTNPALDAAFDELAVNTPRGLPVAERTLESWCGYTHLIMELRQT